MHIAPLALEVAREVYFLTSVQCSSSALRLIDCGHSGIGVHNCDHTDDAGVKCQRTFSAQFNSCEEL